MRDPRRCGAPAGHRAHRPCLPPPAQGPERGAQGAWTHPVFLQGKGSVSVGQHGMCVRAPGGDCQGGRRDEQGGGPLGETSLGHLRDLAPRPSVRRWDPGGVATGTLAPWARPRPTVREQRGDHCAAPTGPPPTAALHLVSTTLCWGPRSRWGPVTPVEGTSSRPLCPLWVSVSEPVVRKGAEIPLGVEQFPPAAPSPAPGQLPWRGVWLGDGEEGVLLESGGFCLHVWAAGRELGPT